jgi:hypothetical protein
MAGHLSWVTKDDSTESDSIAMLDAPNANGRASSAVSRIAAAVFVMLGRAARCGPTTP